MIPIAVELGPGENTEIDMEEHTLYLENDLSLRIELTVDQDTQGVYVQLMEA